MPAARSPLHQSSQSACGAFVHATRGAVFLAAAATHAVGRPGALQGAAKPAGSSAALRPWQWHSFQPTGVHARSPAAAFSGTNVLLVPVF